MFQQKINSSDLSSIMVIFGGTGDLTHRKLFPALYNLVHDNLLPERFTVVAVGRQPLTNEQYREEIASSLSQFSRNKIKPELWERLSSIIYYYQLDFTEINEYDRLKLFLDELDNRIHVGGNRVFYLAVAPEFFEQIVHGLDVSCLAQNSGCWQRLVIEKPFGKDLATANQLNNALHEVFSEQDIYRIDHYMGKDMIQNILVLRFCNLVFSSLWSSQYIDHVQISLAEKHGVGSRGKYYDVSGAMRDMIQNHAIQILSLIAMEPPVTLSTEAIRTEKLKVIQAIEPFTEESLRDQVVFGQYGRGMIDGLAVPAYREENNVPVGSVTETFVALKLHINNFRWAGTPFYIRTGKRLGRHSAEIVIQFKKLPKVLYFQSEDVIQNSNILVIRIQPKVGVSFHLNTKDFSTQDNIKDMNVESSTMSSDQGNTPEAYERLLFDILRGDATLFSRWSEVEASWQLADKIIAHQVKQRIHYPNYDAGSLGPAKSNELMARDGRVWWNE